MTTLNQLIKTIEDLGNAHQQIKTTFYGNAFDFLSKGTDNVYPALFFDLTGASINGKSSTINFTLFFCDRVLPEQSNEQEVLSDQLLTAQDIIAQLHYNDFDFILQDSVTLDFFTEDTPEYLAGVSATIALDLPYLQNRCEVPTDYTYPS
jgi:hypothetical protein